MADAARHALVRRRASLVPTLRKEKQRLRSTNRSIYVFKMKLSPHFTLAEMTTTSHPDLQDSPSVEVIINLVYLCAVVLEPLRKMLGHPVRINSGYRSVRLNKEVGGVPNSYHLTGRAADIFCKNLGEARLILTCLRDVPQVDFAIIEKKRGFWVHVQTSDTPRHIIKTM